MCRVAALRQARTFFTAGCNRRATNLLTAFSAASKLVATTRGSSLAVAEAGALPALRALRSSMAASAALRLMHMPDSVSTETVTGTCMPMSKTACFRLWLSVVQHRTDLWQVCCRVHMPG